MVLPLDTVVRGTQSNIFSTVHEGRQTEMIVVGRRTGRYLHGNHYHLYRNEYYVVTVGFGEVFLREEDGELERQPLQPGTAIRVPNGTAHCLALGEGAVVVCYSDSADRNSVADTEEVVLVTLEQLDAEFDARLTPSMRGAAA